MGKVGKLEVTIDSKKAVEECERIVRKYKMKILLDKCLWFVVGCFIGSLCMVIYLAS